jgi:hypothetical protein
MRYRLRTLMILVTMVGLLCGYWHWYKVRTYAIVTSGGGVIRIHRTHLEAIIFKPAARVEGISTGAVVRKQ